MDHLLRSGLDIGRTTETTKSRSGINRSKVDGARSLRDLAAMPPTSVAYRLFIHLGFSAVRPLGAFDAKARRGLSLRAGAVARLRGVNVQAVANRA